MSGTRHLPGRARRSRCAGLALLTLAVVGLSGQQARSDELVIFRDARTLRVRGVERAGGSWRLDLGRGNSALVPVDQVVKVKRLPDPKPPPPVSQWREQAGPFAQFIEAAASKFQIEPELLVAVAIAESALDPLARSEKGALGVMQIMPGTAVELGLDDPFDAQKNIDAGARFLREMLDLFENDLDLALAAYNAGQGAVRRHGGVPPFPETRQYLVRVRRLLEELRIVDAPDA